MMKGISPIVAMVLLIAISVIAAVGVYFWIGQYTSKPGTPSMPEMMSISTIGNGKVMVVNLGQEPLNLTTLRTSDPHVWVTMCEVNASDPVLGPGEQAVCDLLTNSGFNGSKTVEVYGNGTNIVALPVNEETADRSLVGWWSFDDVSGSTVPDDSGNGNDGTLYNSSGGICQINTNGCAKTVPAVFGRGLDMDGNGEIVKVPDNPTLDPPNGFTVFIWAKEHSVSSWQGVVSKLTNVNTPGHGRGWNIQMGTSDNVGLLLANATGNSDYLTTNNNPQANLWYNICLVSDPDAHTNSLYMNGSYIKSNTLNVAFTDNPLIMGIFYTDGSGLYFNGTMDNLAYFSRPLKGYEIKWLYKWGLPRQ